PPAAPPPPPAAPQDATPATPTSTEPKKAPATWSLVYADGSPVQGFKSMLTRASQKDDQELSPDGSGRNQVVSMNEEEGFSVVPMGTKKVEGQVLDPDGKPVKNAQVMITRAFGDSIEVKTDGS